MAFFVKLYDNAENAEYLGLIADSIAAQFNTVGKIGDGGLFTQTDDSGEITTNKKYEIARHQIYFKTGVEADDGDFLLHGTLYVSETRSKTVIIRVNSSGAVRWCKSYYQDITRFNVRLVKGSRDTYFFSSWIDKGRGVDDLEIVKIDGFGSVLTAVNIPTSSSRHHHEMIPENGGVIIYGGTGLLRSYQSFVIHLDSSLRFVWGRHVGQPSGHQIIDLVKKDAETFIAVGEMSADRKSFILPFNTGLTTHTANSYDFLVGNENGPRQIIQTESAYYVVHYSEPDTQSTVQKYDRELNLVWIKEIDISGTTHLLDILNTGDATDELLVTGYNVDAGSVDRPMLVYTDEDFNSCSTVALSNPRNTTERFTSREWVPLMVSPIIREESHDVSVTDIEPTINRICPSSNLDLDGNVLFQSPYVYLQAAGSDESDDSVRGFHLRWDLLRDLGENHLPKGDYSAVGGAYPTTIGYNRPDDYVRIYKTEFTTAYYIDVDFSVVPSSRTEVGLTRSWRYNGFIPVSGAPSNTTDVEVVFTNRAKYDIVKSTIDPAVNPLAFIQAYDDIIEVRALNKKCFSARFTITNLATNLRYETISIKDDLDPDTRYISCRKTVSFGSNETIYCDNMEYIRFDYDSDSAPSNIRLITYDDYILGKNLSGGWSTLDQFALDDGNADTNTAVFKRLEDSVNYSVDGRWRKYNEPDVNAAGEFRVSVPNYQNRWTMVEGLKEAVTTYLDVSKTDLKAVVTHTNDDPVVNDSQMDISYLDMLNFVALDYHVARMLGLGHIDHDATADEEHKFIYLMKYVTDAALEPGETPETKKHIYMTLPTSVADHRLPPAPVQKDITYGVYGDNKTGTPTLLTTPDGYNPYGPTRYINIHREEFEFEKPFESFYARPDDFCLCSETETVLFGLEYAEEDIVTANRLTDRRLVMIQPGRIREDFLKLLRFQIRNQIWFMFMKKPHPEFTTMLYIA